MSKRRYKRYTKRLETEFSAANMTYKGISSDLSEKGLFIRTQHGFVPGTKINIKLLLPDGTISHLKGIVRRTVKTPHRFVKNGMGIELIETDIHYENFLMEELIGYDRAAKPQSPTPEDSPKPEASPPKDEFVIVSCPSCGVKNKVSKKKISLKPRCGRCGTYLTL